MFNIEKHSVHFRMDVLSQTGQIPKIRLEAEWVKRLKVTQSLLLMHSLLIILFKNLDLYFEYILL